MTKQIISFTLLLLTGIFSLQAADSKPIRIGTNDIDLILKIGDPGITQRRQSFFITEICIS